MSSSSHWILCYVCCCRLTQPLLWTWFPLKTSNGPLGGPRLYQARFFACRVGWNNPDSALILSLQGVSFGNIAILHFFLSQFFLSCLFPLSVPTVLIVLGYWPATLFCFKQGKGVVCWFFYIPFNKPVFVSLRSGLEQWVPWEKAVRTPALLRCTDAASHGCAGGHTPSRQRLPTGHPGGDCSWKIHLGHLVWPGLNGNWMA